MILHRDEIKTRRGAFAILQDAERRAAFDADLLDLLKAGHYFLISVVLDKVVFFARNGRGADPYARCLSELLERYCTFLLAADAAGDVIGEARKEHVDRAVREAYSFYFEHRWADGSGPLTTREIKLKPKYADTVGVQLADLLAYPTKQDALLNAGHPINMGEFTGQVCERVREKYLTDGRILVER